MNSAMNSRRFLVLAAALAGASLASGQLLAGEPDRGEGMRIGRAPQASAGGDAKSFVRSETTTRTDDVEVKVISEGGETRIYVDGREVSIRGHGEWTDKQSGLHIQRSGPNIVVTKDGEEVLTHSGEAGLWRRFQAAAGGGDGAPAPAPRVMLGVTLDSIENAGEELELTLKKLPEHATVIRRVMPGLPAAKAGIQEMDVIVEIEGSSEADPESLRELLAEKKPGEKLRLKILREGKPQTLVVELAPYDSEVLGVIAPRARGVGGEYFFSTEGFKELEELQRTLAAQAKEMSQLQESIAGRSGADAQRLAQTMAELARKMGAQTAELTRRSAEMNLPNINRYRFDAAEGGGAGVRLAPGSPLKFRNGGDGSRAIILPPNAPGAPGTPGTPGTSTPSDERIDELNSRLDRLERLLERLVDERKNDR